MILRRPGSPLFPYTTLFRSIWAAWLGFVQYGGVGGSVFGLVAIVLLFGCVLLHEIAHSLYAGRLGIAVEYIVLLPIGGLTSIRSEEHTSELQSLTNLVCRLL